MSYTLGVDIGTFESKGVLVDRDGSIVASAARPHDMLVPQPGWAEQDPALWETALGPAIAAALDEAGRTPEDVRALGVAGQRGLDRPLLEALVPPPPARRQGL